MPDNPTPGWPNMTAPRTRLRFEREWACILPDGGVLHGVQEGLGTLQYPTMPQAMVTFPGPRLHASPLRARADDGGPAYPVFWHPRTKARLPETLTDAFAALKDTPREDLVAALFDPRPAVQRLAARRLQAIDSSPMEVP